MTPWAAARPVAWRVRVREVLRLGLTRKETCRRLGVSPSTLERWCFELGLAMPPGLPRGGRRRGAGRPRLSDGDQ